MKIWLLNVIIKYLFIDIYEVWLKSNTKFAPLIETDHNSKMIDLRKIGCKRCVT